MHESVDTSDHNIHIEEDEPSGRSSFDSCYGMFPPIACIIILLISISIFDAYIQTDSNSTMVFQMKHEASLQPITTHPRISENWIIRPASFPGLNHASIPSLCGSGFKKSGTTDMWRFVTNRYQAHMLVGKKEICWRPGMNAEEYLHQLQHQSNPNKYSLDFGGGCCSTFIRHNAPGMFRETPHDIILVREPLSRIKSLWKHQMYVIYELHNDREELTEYIQEDFRLSHWLAVEVEAVSDCNAINSIGDDSIKGMKIADIIRKYNDIKNCFQDSYSNSSLLLEYHYVLGLIRKFTNRDINLSWNATVLIRSEDYYANQTEVGQMILDEFLAGEQEFEISREQATFNHYSFKSHKFQNPSLPAKIEQAALLSENLECQCMEILAKLNLLLGKLVEIVVSEKRLSTYAIIPRHQLDWWKEIYHDKCIQTS